MLKTHMAPADRNPNRRASPIPATDSATSKDEGFERTTIGPMPQAESTPVVSDELTRRVDLSDNRGYADDWYPTKEKKPRVKEQRLREASKDKLDVKDKPDVIGAPERTVIAPLPRRHEEVEPIPDAASTSGARYAAEAEVRKQRRADEEARRRNDAAARRDARRRDAGLSARDKIVERDGRGRDERASDDWDSPRDPVEKTNPGIAAVAVSPARKERAERPERLERAESQSRDERPADRLSDRPSERANDRANEHGADRSSGQRPAAREERPPQRQPGQELVHQSTAIEKAKNDGPWARLGVAIKDVSRAVATSTKESWHILRTQGPKPLWLKAKPQLARGWVATRDFVLRIRNKAVHKAVELGWMKPKRYTDYEQHGDDRLDQGRVDAWRKFHKGKTSSSYLQDDE